MCQKAEGSRLGHQQERRGRSRSPLRKSPKYGYITQPPEDRPQSSTREASQPSSSHHVDGLRILHAEMIFQIEKFRLKT